MYMLNYIRKFRKAVNEWQRSRAQKKYIEKVYQMQVRNYNNKKNN